MVRGVVVVEFIGGIEGGRAEQNRVGREPELQVFLLTRIERLQKMQL